MSVADSGYFSRFPTITYNGKEVLDLTRRVRLSDSTMRQPNVFYPYTLIHEMRPDTLAFDYYQDPNVEWLPYLSNGIIDPYYGWYLTNDEFAKHLEAKYYPNSVDDTQLRIHHWVTNWAEAELNISPSYFENQLPERLKKYWIPNYGLGAKILSYRRREEDWTTSTNRLVRFDLANVKGPGFFVTELLDFKGQGLNVGFGEVVNMDGDSIYVKNLVDIYDGPEITLEGHGGTSADIVGVTTLSEDIPLDEAVYWSPITTYEWENEKNEANKQITLIDVEYIPSLLRELTKKLNS